MFEGLILFSFLGKLRWPATMLARICESRFQRQSSAQPRMGRNSIAQGKARQRSRRDAALGSVTEGKEALKGRNRMTSPCTFLGVRDGIGPMASVAPFQGFGGGVIPPPRAVELRLLGAEQGTISGTTRANLCQHPDALLDIRLSGLVSFPTMTCIQ